MKLKEIPQHYDLLTILREMGVKVKGVHSKWCLCPMPFHPHSPRPTPSFSVYYDTSRQKQYFKCHGNCGAAGDVIDFIGYLHIPHYERFTPQLYMQAAALLISGVFTPSPVLVPPPIPCLPPSLWEEAIPPSKPILRYCHARGLTEREIALFRLGTAPKDWRERYHITSPETWLTIPTFHGGRLMGIKLRSINTGLRYLSVPGSRKGLFNHDAVSGASGSVLVLKGEIAVMVAHRFGLLACAPTGGECSYVDDIQAALVKCKPIVVGDNDPPPHSERSRRRAALRALALGAQLKFPPQAYQDIDQWLLASGDAVDEIKQWMEE